MVVALGALVDGPKTHVTGWIVQGVRGVHVARRALLVLAAIHRRHHAQRRLVLAHGQVLLQLLDQAVQRLLRRIGRTAVPVALQRQHDRWRRRRVGDTDGFGLAQANGVSRFALPRCQEDATGFCDVAALPSAFAAVPVGDGLGRCRRRDDPQAATKMNGHANDRS